MFQSPQAGLGRRRFLKGTSLGAGSVLLGGMTDRMARAAEGVPTAPRFLFVVEGNGVPVNQVRPNELPELTPKEQETFQSQSLADLTLPIALSPVARYQDCMAIVQNLSGDHLRGNHSADMGSLGAFFSASGRRLPARTIDCELGQLHPGVLPSTTLGISAHANYRLTYNLSVSAPGRVQPTLLHPMLAYERLFASVAEGDAASRFKLNRYLLDYMRDDIRQTRQSLGAVDREKLDSYLSSFEDLKGESNRLVDIRDRLENAAPVLNDKFESNVETDRLDAQFELAAAGMIAGLSNVVTIASGVGASHLNVRFTGLGIEPHKHQIGHKCDNWEEHSIAIRKFHFELINRFMQKMESMPEGDGTMLDNTIVVYLSDSASAHHGGNDTWPVVLLGGRNSSLAIDGRYLTYPYYGKANHRTLNTLYTTLLHAAGDQRETFGEPDPKLDAAMAQGPLSELLA